MTAETVIEVRDLRKRYGKVAAVDGISFEIAEGEVFALLGPNGAGKSTTIEILEGFRKPSDGTVRVLGFDPYERDREFRERIGIVLQDVSQESMLTVEENLRLIGAVYRERLEVDQVLELVGLSDKKRRRIKSLSGGERRRLDLGMGLLADPDGALLRRTDHRLRSRSSPGRLAASRDVPQPRQDHPSDHPLHGRGPVFGRPRSHYRQRKIAGVWVARVTPRQRAEHSSLPTAFC